MSLASDWPLRGRHGTQLEWRWADGWTYLGGNLKALSFFFFPDCKYTVHERCVSKNIPGCVKTCSKTKRGGEVSATYCHGLLHAASQATCPSPQIPGQKVLSSPFSASRTPLKSSRSSINPSASPWCPLCAKHCVRGYASYKMVPSLFQNCAVS